MLKSKVIIGGTVTALTGGTVTELEKNRKENTFACIPIVSNEHNKYVGALRLQRL